MVIILAAGIPLFTLAQQNDDDELPNDFAPAYNNKHLNNGDYSPQRNILIQFTPLPLWPALKFEAMVANYHSIGVHFKGFPYSYNNNIPSGVNIQPFYRYYLHGKAPEGPFAQLKYAIGSFKNYDTFAINDDCLGNCIYPNRFLTMGGGAAFGYQLLMGANKRGSFDVFGGFSFHIPTDVDYGGLPELHVINLYGEFWFFDFGMRLGFAF